MEEKKEKDIKPLVSKSRLTKDIQQNIRKKEKNRISAYKSSCKKFIKEFANLKDLKEVESLIILRKNFFKKDEKN